MADYISREAAVEKITFLCELREIVCNPDDEFLRGLKNALNAIKSNETIPSADVQPVGRCKDCVYFKPAHVRCADGSEKAYSEFPEEAFEPNFGLGVTNDYGINVGSQCVYDEWCGGYIDDKTVFRKEDDFCSRFKSGARMDGDTNG